MVMDFSKKLLILAPMAGYTNGACRKIFREYGADATVSEFVYCAAVLHGAPRVFDKISFDDDERPVGIQIFGSDPSEMAAAAKLIEERLSPDFIDVNFGCPAPNATRAGAGAALLKNPPLMCDIIKKMRSTLKKTPVTAKMRIGWDRSRIVVPDAARALEDAGVQMLTVHGRTKAQGYEGGADWKLVEDVAKTLKIPVIGNGSVEKLSPRELADSACSGFMIGRAALGNPWIFSRTRARMENPDSVIPPEPTPQERARLAYRYAELVASKGYVGIDAENLAFAKIQIMRFLKNAPSFKKLRIALKSVNNLGDLKEILCEYL